MIETKRLDVTMCPICLRYIYRGETIIMTNLGCCHSGCVK